VTAGDAEQGSLSERALEIIVISITWLTLVAAGPLLAFRFHRAKALASGR